MLSYQILISDEGVTTLTLPDIMDDLSPPENFIKEVKADELTKLQGSDATWHSFILNLPRGTKKWILNSSIDTLTTKTNLK